MNPLLAEDAVVYEQASLFSAFSRGEDSPAESLSKTMAQSLQKATFTVVDIETTGLNAKKNSITELTAIQYVEGVEIAKLSSLMKPKEPIPPEVESLTGISDEMVKNAPPPLIVLNDFLDFLEQTPLIVGHNVSFDIGFLQEKAREHGLFPLVDRLAIQRAFCTKVLAQKVLPGLPSYEGILVAAQIGHRNTNAHRAEADVKMSAAILFSLMDRLQNSPSQLTTVQDLLDYQGQLQLRH